METQAAQGTCHEPVSGLLLSAAILSTGLTSPGLTGLLRLPRHSCMPASKAEAKEDGRKEALYLLTILEVACTTSLVQNLDT